MTATIKTCPICLGGAMRDHRSFPSGLDASPCEFRRCTACGCITDVAAPPVDYRAPATAETGEDPRGPHLMECRFYLEGVAPYPTLAGLLARLELAGATPGSGRPRFLDVGAHLGLGVELARAAGWEACGIEPAACRGWAPALFRFDLLGGLLEEHVGGIPSADRVLVSEVLEHVPHPGEFLTALRSLIAPGGVALLTTPDAEVLERPDHPEHLDLLYSPGHHRHIFTAGALEHLLRGAGFDDVRVDRTGGAVPGLIALVSPNKGGLKKRPSRGRVRKVVRRRLLEWCDEVVDHPWPLEREARRSLRLSARWLRARLRLEHGDYTGAGPDLEAIIALVGRDALGPPSEALIADPSPTAYLEAHPGFTPALLAGLGARELLSRGRPARAIPLLQDALAHATVQQATGAFPVAATTAWTRLHLAHAHLVAGCPELAQEALGGLEEGAELLGRAEGTRRLQKARAALQRRRPGEALAELGRAFQPGLLPLPLSAWPVVRRMADRLGV